MKKCEGDRKEDKKMTEEPDREKIIKAFEIHNDRSVDCTECPYNSDNSCLEDLMEDVLALLKKQEPVEPKWTDFEDPFTGENFKLYQCGNCGSYLLSDALYCSRCGRKVKYDEYS